jgi:nucleotide-binding universal stress UspA family protein
MTRILLALHGGPTSEGAVNVARSLRDRTGAEIEAVAVLEPPPILDYGYGPVYIPDAATEAMLEEELRAQVERQLARGDLTAIKPSILHGPRVSSIAGAATARHASLIVIGLGPHQLTDRALGGETALHLAQQASTPVLAVPAGMRCLPHRILAAADFSPSSLWAARTATTLITAGGILELAYVGAAARIGGVVLGPHHTRDAQRRLGEFAAEIQVPAGVRKLMTVFAGEPAPTLLDVASQTGADLIALGSHGYSPWQRLLLGSVSWKILRLAQCAVLIYPARCVATSDAPVRNAESAGAVGAYP